MGSIYLLRAQNCSSTHQHVRVAGERAQCFLGGVGTKGYFGARQTARLERQG
jgi:hypothetical protein